MRSFFALSTLCLLVCVPLARAADDIVEFALSDAKAIVDGQRSVPDVTFHFAGQAPRPALEWEQEVSVTHRTRNHGRATSDCNWTMATALKELAAEARKLGADTLVDVQSNWKHLASHHAGYYQCAIGKLIVGVALRGKAGRAPRPASVTPPPVVVSPTPASIAPAPVDQAMTYQAAIGSGAVRATFMATPDRDATAVRVILALSTDGLPADAKPRATCDLGVELKAGKRAAKKPRYERGTTQEVFESEVDLDVLRQLAIDDGAFVLCKERIRIKRSSRAALRSLVDAVDEHNARKLSEPSGGLSL